MKKLPAFSLPLAIAIVVLGLPPMATGQFNPSNPFHPWEWEEISPTELKITGYTGSGGAESIPSSLGQYAVTAIGSASESQTPVFVSWKSSNLVTSVAIPNTVTHIGDFAFAGCVGLTVIGIPTSVTNIGWSAFGGCSGLTNVTIPSSVTYVGDQAFSGCTNLPSITILDSVTYLGIRAFDSCYGLTNASVGNGVTALSENVFSSCTNLSSVSIGSGVTSIGVGAFSGCYSLTNIVIPGNVTAIAEGAFASCTSLTNINIPNSVTEIFEDVFIYCRALSNLTIGTGLKTIGEKAFSYTALTNVVIPDNVTAIGASCFYGAPIVQISMPPPLLALVGSIGLQGPLATEKLIEGLKLAGFATKSDLGTVVSNTVSQIQSNPTDYNLFTLAQNEARYNEGITAGTSLVTANPASYSLYTSNSIMDLRMGGLMIQKQGTNATVVFQPQSTTDLATLPFTNNGTPITNTVPMPGNKGFLRMRGGGASFPGGVELGGGAGKD